jgi:hypothetical protein
MKQDVVLAMLLQAIVMGAGLVAYAHANFATVSVVESMKITIDRIDERVYQLAQKEGIK